MGLIIKKSIRKLIKGYPTVSDKYNVQGGLLGGSADAHFGDVLIYGATQGEYAVPAAAITVADIAGILLGTNVKLATTYPAGPSYEVVTKPGEAINLLLNGYVAVGLDAGATTTNIKDGAKVACLLATGALTTSGTANATDIPGWYFTGVYENKGTNEAPVYVAEIVIK